MCCKERRIPRDDSSAIVGDHTVPSTSRSSTHPSSSKVRDQHDDRQVVRTLQASVLALQTKLSSAENELQDQTKRYVKQLEFLEEKLKEQKQQQKAQSQVHTQRLELEEQKRQLDREQKRLALQKDRFLRTSFDNSRRSASKPSTPGSSKPKLPAGGKVTPAEYPTYAAASKFSLTPDEMNQLSEAKTSDYTNTNLSFDLRVAGHDSPQHLDQAAARSAHLAPPPAVTLVSNVSRPLTSPAPTAQLKDLQIWECIESKGIGVREKPDPLSGRTGVVKF
jgi:hypothetical protein